MWEAKLHYEANKRGWNSILQCRRFERIEWTKKESDKQTEVGKCFHVK